MFGARSRHSSRISVLFIALLAIVSMFALSACGTEAGSPSASSESEGSSASAGSFRTLDQIKQDGTIRIGVFGDKAPFGYVDSNGEYAGYDIEYGNRLAKDLGVEVEYTPVEAASRVEFVDTGKVDLILANFTVTPERKEKVDFANPYMKVSLGVVTPDNAQVKDVKELADKTVIVVKGTTAEAYLEKNHSEVKLQKYEQYTEATNALIDGRGDLWVTDNTEALAWAAKTDGFSVPIKDLGDVDTIAGAVAKGNDTLLNWINENLVELGKEEFFHKDFEKTLKPVYGDQVTADELVIEGGKL